MLVDREQVRRNALDRDQLRARAEHGMSDIYDWDRHDRWPPDTCLALLADLEQAERHLEGVHLALAEADVPRADGVDEPLYSEQHRVRLLRERAEQAERERDERVPREEADRREDAWRYEIVCSVCGWNHDRDESAACDGCEAITLEEFLSKCRDGMPGLVEALHDARTRLAAVPALVEALHRITVCEDDEYAHIAEDALAAYEEAQG